MSMGDLIDFYPTIYLYEPTITGLHRISFTTKNKSHAKIDVRVCTDENLFWKSNESIGIRVGKEFNDNKKWAADLTTKNHDKLEWVKERQYL